MAPGRSGVDWAAADGRSGPDRSGAVRCVPCVWREQLRRLISPHALLLAAALTKSGCSENMFPALEPEAQHTHKETNREARGGEAEWDKWSGTAKREEKTLGARRRKLKADWANGFLLRQELFNLLGRAYLLRLQ